MEINIKYNSKWGNSFLSSDENDERKYIASLSNMNSNKNKDNKLDFYKRRDITLKTVYGIIYRLLGAREPLNKLLIKDKSLIKEMIEKNLISFENKIIYENDEIVYLRNNSLSTDQNSYSGVPDDKILEQNIKQYINVLFYNRSELVDYLTKDILVNIETNNISIIDISKKLEEKYKDKSLIINVEERNLVNSKYKEVVGINEDIHINANLMLLAINKSIKLFSKENKDCLKYLTNKGTFSGVSLNGNSFTLKDFMKKFANTKIVYGNPYMTDFWIKNEYSKEGKNIKFNKQLTKSSGILKIKINCDIESSLKIKEMIENAGVSSFYLGKKGLAYVEKITL